VTITYRPRPATRVSTVNLGPTPEGGHEEIKLLKHIFALCSLPDILSKTFSLAALTQLHFMPQLEIHICSVIFLVFLVLFSLRVSFQHELKHAYKKSHKIVYKTSKNRLRLGLCPRAPDNLLRFFIEGHRVSAGGPRAKKG